MATIEQKILDELYELAERVGGANARLVTEAIEQLDGANCTSTRLVQADSIRLAGELLGRMKDLPPDDATWMAKLSSGLAEYADALTRLAEACRNCAM